MYQASNFVTKKNPKLISDWISNLWQPDHLMAQNPILCGFGYAKGQDASLPTKSAGL